MFVVGWNKAQCDSFTVETLEEHLRYNLDAFHGNTNAGVAMLGLFETKEEASDFRLTLQEVRNARLDAEESTSH